jgi:hypothetical protein
MPDRRFEYNQGRERIFAADRAQALQDVIVIGRDQNGLPRAWSTMDERATRELLTEHNLVADPVA